MQSAIKQQSIPAASSAYHLELTQHHKDNVATAINMFLINLLIENTPEIWNAIPCNSGKSVESWHKTIIL